MFPLIPVPDVAKRLPVRDLEHAGFLARNGEKRWSLCRLLGVFAEVHNAGAVHMAYMCCPHGLPGCERSISGEDKEINKAQSATSSSLAGATIDSLDVSLEHNTLVIMWPPTQEEWRHEVRHGITAVLCLLPRLVRQAL